MKNFKSHFVFNRSQQNGIFLLVIIIISLQLIYHFSDFNSGTTIYTSDSQNLTAVQHTIDSLKAKAKVEDTIKIFPFNPNYLTDYKGYVLGMSTTEIDRLLAYRKNNKWINSSEEFQEVTRVSDSLLIKIAPYFKFPDWINTSITSFSKNSSKQISSKISRVDLNKATIEELVKVKGIGEVLAGRIVKYRSKIGGFLSDIQLKDIYGLNAETRTELLIYFTVQITPEIKIININEASVLQLSELPYIDYELAREIINYKLLHEKINSFDELAKIKDFPSEKIDRIALYLSVD